MNYFAHETAAERYARSRPYFHPLVMQMIRRFLRLESAVAVAVDVACGTGQSALALTEIADLVVAADVSCSMLAQAPAHARIRYVNAPAEQLPLHDCSANLITVSLAFHWFDQERFLGEARSILRPGGTLVIYGNEFHGKMIENDAFASWYESEYFRRYPTPPRDKRLLTDDRAHESGFAFRGRESYRNEIGFSPERLAAYLTTHSNVIAAVEAGSESLAAVQSWLVKGIAPFFASAEGTFIFGGDVWYLRHAGGELPEGAEATAQGGLGESRMNLHNQPL